MPNLRDFCSPAVAVLYHLAQLQHVSSCTVLYCTVLYCTVLYYTVLTLPSTCLPVLLLKGAVMVTEPAVASSILKIEPGNMSTIQVS